VSNFGFTRDDDVVDQPILDKFHVLRKVGNTAVHASGDVKKATARLLLNELFHVVVWAAQRYTVHPDDVPVHAQFSPSRISSDRTGATGSADHTVLRRTAERQQAEITELRAAIADARARRTGSDTHDYYEAATRRVLVDELLHEAGWDPVIFYSNGVDTYLWDDTEGYPPRRTQGFYTRAELENLVARRGGRPLAEVLSDVLSDAPDGTDGTDAQRPAIQDRAAHHRQAVRATVTAFDHRQRGALLVMAPGTGRVATTAAIVDVLAEAGWADRVAYLADDARRLERARTALAELDRPGIYTMTYSQMMDRVERLEFGPGSSTWWWWTRPLHQFGMPTTSCSSTSTHCCWASPATRPTRSTRARSHCSACRRGSRHSSSPPGMRWRPGCWSRRVPCPSPVWMVRTLGRRALR